MRFTKRHIFYFITVVVIAFVLSTYQLPFYIYKPGGADALNPVVKVEGGHESEGDMHLVTVRGGQATPIQYAWAKVFPHQEILPLSQVRPEGVTEDEYMHVQLQMMENSQEASTVVAYQAAEADISITYEGVYVVAVVEEMPADGILKMGDRITSINGDNIEDAEGLISYVENMSAGDTITLDINRNDKQLTEEITLETFADSDNKVGIGIQLVTDRSVQVNPEVNFTSGNIGGPSAGLMFSLEIYDQLTESDLTKGYQIAGTGEVDYEGNVARIGGIDKKVIAADREGCDVFFAPNENGGAGSNYEIAKEAAAEIETDMEIVPVDTFEDALNYLNELEPSN
ncbi:SepM family pheromone-processing serine protease [Virgibacillus byunsanensis]|uniref:endopeptidase La n=1 Tax=Virgibacillus byunsanensis TaxID=570945 RepID=A0ABW3LL27_9BACI